MDSYEYNKKGQFKYYYQLYFNYLLSAHVRGEINLDIIHKDLNDKLPEVNILICNLLKRNFFTENMRP